MGKAGRKETIRNLETGMVVFARDHTVLYASKMIRKWFEEPAQLWKIARQKQYLSGTDVLPASWIIRQKGMVLQLNLYSYSDSANETRIILHVTDITPLEKMEEQLAEAKAVRDELDATIQNSYDAIYIVDANGITRKTNDAIERLTGIPKEYYIGKDMRYLEKRGFIDKSVSMEVIKQKKPVTLIQENWRGKVIMMTGSPVFNDQGEVIRVVTNLRDITELNRLREELSQLRKFHAKDEPVVVASPAMKQVMEVAGRVAITDTTVLLLGESGVGKEVVARMIHKNSKQYEKGSFIKVNCGAIPQELLESELFGYESGAFTGANKNGKPGLFELANNGTLFLDEIGELPLHLQVKLLRVLQDQEFHRVGGVKTKKVSTRIIAATNRNLKKMVADGQFREDLYYRLYVVPIEIPPLRKRPEEILPLTRFFLDKYNRKYQTEKKLTPEALKIFQNYPWPGNIRELANFIERLVVTTSCHEILPEHLSLSTEGHITVEESLSVSGKQTENTNVLLHGRSDFWETEGFRQAIEQAECSILTAAFKKYGSSYEVARALKISQSTAIRKAYKYGIRCRKRKKSNR